MVNINYTVSDDFLTVKPEHRQAAGVMGQEKSCSVTFTLPSVVSTWHKRIEFVDTTGKLFTTDDNDETLMVVGGNTVSITLPWEWTVYGGTAFIRLVAYSVGANGNIEAQVATPDRALLFENRNTGDDTVVRRSLSQLILDGHAAIKETNEVYEEVKEAYESGKFVGATPDLSVGLVKTLEAGKDAFAEILGTPEKPQLYLAIPRGDKGDKPVKGEDYFTETDKQEIYDELLPEAAQAAVHIGSEQPTNPNTKVWINPNGNADVLQEAVDTAVTTALATAKESGEFDGEDGVTPNLTFGTITALPNFMSPTASITGTKENPVLNLGVPKGADGKTPVVGVDYFTEADKAAMVQGVLDALPTWEGGAY